MGKIKVIHVITRFDKGGAAENTYLTIKGLDKNRYEVILIRGLSYESNMGTSETRAVESSLEEAGRNGVKIFTIPELVRRIDPFNDFKTFLKLIRIFRQERPHIVHTHTSKSGILGRWAALVVGVPVIIHTPHGHVFWGYFNRWKTKLYVLLERLTATVTNKIVTLTEQEKKDHVRYRIAGENKFAVIHSGVDLSKFSNVQEHGTEMKKKLGIPEQTFVVGTVGRLTAIKGHKYLIEAAARILPKIPQIVFVFLGDGELMNELKMQAALAGIGDKVKFLGWLPNIAEFMSTFDIFVLPSLNEGMGKVLVEAMAARKPIIASDIGGISDLVIHGKNGLLVAPMNSDALANSIELVLRNSQTRTNMGEEGQRLSQKYDVNSMISKIDGLYLQLLTLKH
ncbi:MAG: glycosyltransferase family 4 protein [Syntrophales bacterium]|jgi:glycosyltransferase involved in cell wall biosynthesis